MYVRVLYVRNSVSVCITPIPLKRNATSLGLLEEAPKPTRVFKIVHLTLEI